MIDQQTHRITIPKGLRNKLSGFRGALIRQAVRDSVAWWMLATLMLFAAFLLLERFVEVPVAVRVGLEALLVIGIAVVIGRIGLVVARCRTSMQVATVIGSREPLFGDHLVGALELAESESEQARSATLCEAALEQVAQDAEGRDLSQALPISRWRSVARGVIALAVLLAGVTAFAPQLVQNAAWRLFTPLAATPRYTFSKLSHLPETLVVPHDEPSSWTVRLDPSSKWIPGHASISIAGRSIEALKAGEQEYHFELPALIRSASADIRVGDAVGQIHLVPKLRPEPTRIRTLVHLPDYLNRTGANQTDSSELVGGEIELLDGSHATVLVQVSAALSQASVDGRPLPADGNEFSFGVPSTVEQVEVNWTDSDGLAASKPLKLTVRNIADSRPTLLVQADDVPSRLLDSQILKFGLQAQDDFAVRRVGMEWIVDGNIGNRVLGPDRASGGSLDEAQLSAVFQATALSVSSGEVNLRFWVEDDFPGRERVYSEPIALNVLSPNEHAVWIAQQFARWRQSAMDVRDRELNLFERNRELAKTEAERRDGQWRAAVAVQARAEEFNGRQLETLTSKGERLLRMAARNEEVAAEYVETLAETIESLEKMAGEKMPRVAELLKQAADSEDESKFADMLDQETSQGNAPDSQVSGEQPTKTDEESASQSERLGLAGTTITDTSKRKPKADDDQEDSLKLAIEDQTDLVAEFDAVAEELRELLGNMEGSTLVKRLKSVSRLQDRVAMQLGRTIEQTFGKTTKTNEETLQSVGNDIADSAKRVRTVLDDLEAFCERRDIEHFADVLAEMKASEVLQRLGAMRDDLLNRPGMSISVAEYWADNLDRWADDLVDPGTGETKDGPQTTKSLPPKVILQVLRILESEVNLREQTRVAHQGRDAMERDRYMSEAIRLSEAQDLLRDKLDVLVDQIEALPEGVVSFAGEMEVLDAASAAMVDASKTLISPETGPPAVAAQTEAIELLLRSKKVSPESGGGEGGSSVSGNGGETDQAAIALLGRGLDELAAVRESKTELSTSLQRGDIPEPWREGLDLYFNRLELRRAESDGGRNQ